MYIGDLTQHRLGKKINWFHSNLGKPNQIKKIKYNKNTIKLKINAAKVSFKITKNSNSNEYL